MSNETKNILISITALVLMFTLCIFAIVLIIKFPSRTRVVHVKAVGKSSLVYPEEYYLIDKNGLKMQMSFEDFEEIYNAFNKGYLVYISFKENILDSAYKNTYKDEIYDIEIYLKENNK